MLVVKLFFKVLRLPYHNSIRSLKLVILSILSCFITPLYEYTNMPIPVATNPGIVTLFAKNRTQVSMDAGFYE